MHNGIVSSPSREGQTHGTASAQMNFLSILRAFEKLFDILWRRNVSPGPFLREVLIDLDLGLKRGRLISFRQDASICVYTDEDLA